MQIDVHRARQLLSGFDLEPLLIEELGWDYYNQDVNTEIREKEGDVDEYLLTAIAEKRGMAVFRCLPRGDGRIPNYATRCKIESQVAKSVHEHIIIYTDAEKTTQIWQWVKREPGKPLARREHRYHQGQSGDALIQKLQTISVSIAEEEDLTLVDVTRRVRASFDIERVTKRFYDRFKTEHAQFLKFLNGIPDLEMQRWYASVMLNRLMFIYFIQKKGFLNNDTDYLRTKLTESQANGADQYYTAFLCPLFFEGFAKPEAERSEEAKGLLGAVPYLNGGIFQRHQLEELYGERTEIPDTAFEGLFNFFDQYQWHLDDHTLQNDNEINPDVLGYIFEKYINQKQMGAYYTKEDITEYISKNTIIPFLFDAARTACQIAFEGETSVWQLLKADPDRYIYDAVKTGVELELPEHIAAGMDDVSKRTTWNTPAPDEYALPTEIWREVVARRGRYESIHAKLSNGEIDEVNALITDNLNIRQFAHDVIENCEGPELLRAFWNAITQVTILDPTCGSGAFLFAALNVLEPLYEACLERMQVFLDELQYAVKTPRAERFRDFREVLERIEQHPNRRYFILKSIIINNLYGVDIMEEAIEICKLRLFLKMVAQIEAVEQIEPLPDIDFNIQAGNTLVGYATYDEVEKAVTGKLDFDNTMPRIATQAEDVERLFTLFRQQQTELGGMVKDSDKQMLREKLHALEDELNRFLADEYKVDPNKGRAYQSWLSTHKPFHWFIEFYGILKDGGFDVIIGNPPYVEYSKVKKDYTISGYETEDCGNLYAFVFERSFRLLQGKGWKSMIVPHSAYCTDRMSSLQNLFHRSKRVGWLQTYSIRPAKLFIGADQRLAIYIVQQGSKSSDSLYSSRYYRWNEPFRSHLFETMQHIDITQMSFQNSLPKIHSGIEQSIWKKLAQFSVLGTNVATGGTPYTIYFHNAPRYWLRAMDFAPYFWNERDGEQISTQVKPLHLTTELDAAVATATLNSSLFYWWFVILSDCRHLNLREIRNFPIGIDQMDEAIKQRLSALTEDLMQDLKRHAHRKETNYKTTGRVVYDEFYPRHSKPIIDKIDQLLAEHYDLTDEELDFIINYDIKYRMGLGN